MKSVMDARSPHPARSDAGFALIEVIVSAAVLGLMALAVLSGGTPRELIGALAASDVARFQAVPGIGKRANRCNIAGDRVGRLR